ncbi:MAG: SCO family protein [Acidimicrobiaceae bacterium]|nr:SCO family protein [Acidimicrobiaceae bacterium]
MTTTEINEITPNPPEPASKGGRGGVLSYVIGGSLIVAGVAVGVIIHDRTITNQQNNLANIMGLSPFVGTQQFNFNLTNENGQQMSLSAFRGKSVVVQFMDPKCTDICPIVAKELVDADKQLGSAASNVAFVAVNVNQYHESTAELRQFSKSHGLSNLKNWYYFTGSTSQLKAVWKEFGIFVQPNPTGDVVHTSYYYFLGPNGQAKYVAQAARVSGSQIEQWGQGIAVFSQKAL